MAAAFLFIGGLYHLAFAVLHLFFGRIFKWKFSLLLTTSVNRDVMRVMNLCLIFLFVSVSCVSFFGREVLLNGPAGKMILAFIAGFWFWRALLQVVFFGVRKPLSILFVLVCLAGSALYGLLASGFLLS
jgi:hypothetical protein